MEELKAFSSLMAHLSGLCDIEMCNQARESCYDARESETREGELLRLIRFRKAERGKCGKGT